MRHRYALGDLCEFHRGASIPRERMRESGDYLYIHYGDLYKGFDLRIDVEHPQQPIPFVTLGETIRDREWLQNGDIVYVLTSETVDDLGHAYLFKNPRHIPAVAGTETTIMRVVRQDLLLPAYLNYLLHTPTFLYTLRQYVRGMKVFRVHPDDIARIAIEVPDLADQERVVAVLDQLQDKQELNVRINGYLRVA